MTYKIIEPVIRRCTCGHAEYIHAYSETNHAKCGVPTCKCKNFIETTAPKPAKGQKHV